MKRVLLLLSFFVVGLSGVVGSDDVKKPEPKKVERDIQWPLTDPDVPVVVVSAVTKLGPGQILDVKCLVDCRVVVYPQSALTVTKEVIPDGQSFRQKGNFVGGQKSKTWKGPCTVYLFEPAATQSGVIVDITPYGFKSDAEVLTKTIDVDTGTGPRPPPVDPVNPVDPVIKQASKITVVVCEDLLKRTTAEAAIINDPGFRHYVKSTGGSVELVSSRDAVFTGNGFKPYADKVGLPAVLIFDADGSGALAPLTYFKLPASTQELISQTGKVVKK